MIHKKILLLLISMLSMTLLMGVASASTCPQSVNDIDPVCNGGVIYVDEFDGACRTIHCSESGLDWKGRGEPFVLALACDKPDGAQVEYFEIYRQGGTGAGKPHPEICLGDACISGNGYARGADFDTCEEPEDEPLFTEFVGDVIIYNSADDKTQDNIRAGFFGLATVINQELKVWGKANFYGEVLMRDTVHFLNEETGSFGYIAPGFGHAFFELFKATDIESENVKSTNADVHTLRVGDQLTVYDDMYVRQDDDDVFAHFNADSQTLDVYGELIAEDITATDDVQVAGWVKASELEASDRIEANGEVVITELAGTGNAYLCIDSVGKVFRSESPCI